MKIKKLEIVGFKSFVDRTVINFDHDVTGIVGPNGCGKSNVVDAIKWVQGEQSASRLRGKAMDDVIFNGCESRGPHGFAEVSLTFANDDGLAPAEYREYAEIKVTRRLDRSGKSDYRINGAAVRLMDITNLFLGTGVGRRAYSIIEQGRIGYIVSSKPADRRAIIEEAAGITKFKIRKQAAERKMDATRQNLLRVSDIIGELERNLKSLERQAQKAERYKSYRAEQRDLELHVASFRYLELFGEQKVVAHSLTTASDTADEVRNSLRVREAEIEARRAELQLVSSEVEEAQRESYRLDNEVRALEGDIKQQRDRLESYREREATAERDLSEVTQQRDGLAGERDHLVRALEEAESAEEEASSVLEIETDELLRRRTAVEEAERAVNNARARVTDAQTRIARAEAVSAGFQRRKNEAHTRLTKLRDERDDLAGRVMELAQQRSELEARLDGLRSGRMQTAERKQQVEEELVALREERLVCDADVDRLREELTTKRSRLRSLQELQQRFEGVGAGVRALMTRFAENDEERAARGVLGLVADRVEAPEQFTRALAAALGDKLQHIVVEGVDAGLSAIGFLRDAGKGRAALVPRTPRRSGHSAGVAQGSGVVGRLSDQLRFAEEDRALIEHLLGDVTVMASFDEAIALHRQNPEHGLLVTLDGERIEADGTIIGGAEDDSGAHMLSMKREMRQLEVEVRDLDQRWEARVARQGELRSAIAQRQAEIDSARTEAHDAEIAIVSIEKDLRNIEDQSARSMRRNEDVAGEVEDLSYNLEQAEDEERESQREIESARETELEADQAFSAQANVLEDRRYAVEEQSSRVTEVRVRAAQAKERAEGDRNALDRVERGLTELTHREERLRAEILAAASNQGRVMGLLMTALEGVSISSELAMRAQEVLSEVRVRYDAAQDEMGYYEVELKELRAQIEAVGSSVNELKIRRRELELAIGHLLESVVERHEINLPKILTDYHARELPDAAMLLRIDELQKLISRMGEINLMAIEEFEEKNGRFQYMAGQRADLEDALSQLERAIRQMNKQSREMFKEAFLAINERFKRIYPEMFRGGKAELKLTDPDNILESGVDIIAQPPGKRLGSLELMSGGEKALTAVALIFAIFQYKPSPFCILDEVDAPLDEANISRFAQAIRQMTARSQFIVITHSKRTMEYTDVLYGVTMEQAGISKLVAVELRGERSGSVEIPAAAVA
ncbi:MAG: chromosome segregation protein SMC [Sandaracinaceae bacterium]|nr:chromosome segregation protein SMC [Sandaracinaceae bacterium]